MKILIILSVVISTIFLSSLGILLNIKAIKSFAFFLPTIIILFLILTGNKNGKFDLISYKLYFWCFIISICDFYLFNYGLSILEILFFPIIWVQIFQFTDFDVKQTLKKIIISFFLLNATISFIEYYLKINFFIKGYENIIEDVYHEGFRSTALLGHPLNNAYCMSIILGYIICSSISYKHKFIYFLIGFSSFLSFNARGITLLWFFITILYFIFNLCAVNLLFSTRCRGRY